MTTTVFALGDVTLDADQRSVSTDRGSVKLSAQLFRVAERLMRRPGVVVSGNDLIAAMYPDPDDEPDNADVCMRVQVQQLRYLLMVMSNGAEIRTERGVGYSMFFSNRLAR